MFLGSNLYFLRKRSGITQEALAQRLSVSRQAVSKWESGEVTPELGKLMELADLFDCGLDALLREDLSIQNPSVQFFLVKGFRMVSHVVISSQPEEDASAYLDRWAEKSGLSSLPGYISREIGWSFPYVSEEQRKRFGLRGYVCARILPEGFQPAVSSPEIRQQGDCCYAVLTLGEPEGRDSRQISTAIRTILDTLQSRGISKSAEEGFLPCFELRYEKNGQKMAEVFVQCRGAGDKLELPVKEI